MLINKLPGNKSEDEWARKPLIMSIHSSILAWKSHGQKSLPVYSPWSLKGRTQLSTSHIFIILYIVLRESENFLQL